MQELQKETLGCRRGLCCNGTALGVCVCTPDSYGLCLCWREVCTHLCTVVGSAWVDQRVWAHLCIIVPSARVREGVYVCVYISWQGGMCTLTLVCIHTISKNLWLYVSAGMVRNLQTRAYIQEYSSTRLSLEPSCLSQDHYCCDKTP